MSYTYEETKAILRHPVVHKFMERVVRGHEIAPVMSAPTWRFADRDNRTAPFTLLAACVERAVTEALIFSKDRDRERLFMLLHMVEPVVESGPVDVDGVAKEVATTVEDYAVEMQFGAEGVRSYREHVKAHAPK